MPWTTETVETARLRLRPFREDDKPVIRELMTDAEVRRHLGGPVDAGQLDALRDGVVGERPDVFCIAERETDVALGRVSFDDHRGEWEVGYELVQRVWGARVASESVGAAIGWWWRTDRGDSLIAVTQSANERSCRLLRALGFAFERELEEYGATQSQYRLARPM